MYGFTLWLLTVIVLVYQLNSQKDTRSHGPFRWMRWDSYDEIDKKFSSVNSKTCMTKMKEDLMFPDSTVAQKPQFNQLPTQPWYHNRTTLIHLHNMALNRAFFYSFIFQKLNGTEQFAYQPDWQYYYMSATADLNANPNMINGSAVFFAFNSSYPNWFITLPFNTTLKLFAPKAWRWDDYGDQDNWLREPTKKVAMVRDIGAGLGSNYTHDAFKMNPWYTGTSRGFRWLPDTDARMDTVTKFTYSVGIKYSNTTGTFVSNEYEGTAFFGPASPGALDKDIALPVLFTRPYYDCGQANKWIVSAYSPIVDFMPRYSNWTHLRRATITALVVMDTDFNKLDFNACPVSVGNPGPSYLSGIDRCKTKTTMCKHKMGFGFRRGGYVCICRPGYRYPFYVTPPFQGVDLERATEHEFNSSFQCDTVDWAQVLPNIEYDRDVLMGRISRIKQAYLTDPVRTRGLRSINVSEEVFGPQLKFARRYMPRHIRVGPIHQTTTGVSHYEIVHSHQLMYRFNEENDGGNLTWSESRRVRRKRSLFDQTKRDRMDRIFRKKKSVTAANCHSRSKTELQLPGDVSYGVDDQFEAEARTALRLAHFLSNYLQNVNYGENFGDIRGGGRLHIDHMFGEVIANVMSNYRLWSSGIFFERNSFENTDGSTREYFGPYAFRTVKETYDTFDWAGLRTPYTTEEWFVSLKQRWETNFEGLVKYKMRPYLRSDAKGTGHKRFEYFPISYKAPELKHGRWSRPYFKCDGITDDWVMTYTVPFFGRTRLRDRLQFRGVVTVDVKLDDLDIYQCPQPFYVANAFKNTARCDELSTVCAQIKGLKFVGGGYRCNCAEGFEYPHRDKKMWIEGQLLENEYEKQQNGLFSRIMTQGVIDTLSPVVKVLGMIVSIDLASKDTPLYPFDDLKCRVSSAPYVNTLPLPVVLLTFIMFHIANC